MRNTLLSLGACALLCVATLVGAGAAPLSAPAGARVALQDLGAVESVHCIPGVVHRHRWGWGTGCYRPRAYFYGGRRFVGPRFYGHRRVYRGGWRGRRWR
jgi:hypothetical protein